VLAPLPTQALMEVGVDVGRTPYRIAAAQPAACDAAPDLDGRNQRCGLRGPDAAHAAERGQGQLAERAQSASGPEHCLRQALRVAAPSARAQQQREQLGLGERLGAMASKPLAWSLAHFAAVGWALCARVFAHARSVEPGRWRA